MQINREDLDRLLSLNDRQLKTMVSRISPLELRFMTSSLWERLIESVLTRIVFFCSVRLSMKILLTP
jgi:hypothetical protein